MAPQFIISKEIFEIICMIDFIIVCCKYSSVSNCKGEGGAKSTAAEGRLSSFLRKGERVMFRCFPKFLIFTPPP